MFFKTSSSFAFSQSRPEGIGCLVALVRIDCRAFSHDPPRPSRGNNLTGMHSGAFRMGNVNSTSGAPILEGQLGLFV